MKIACSFLYVNDQMWKPSIAIVDSGKLPAELAERMAEACEWEPGRLGAPELELSLDEMKLVAKAAVASFPTSVDAALAILEGD